MSKTFTVAAVQASAGQLGGPVGDLDRLEALTGQAADAGARLVAWPECAYPAYFLRSVERYRQTAAGRLPFAEALARCGRIARGCGVHLVAGLVEERDDGRLANAAVLFAPDGAELARYRKSFLWHFDRHYFTPGEAVPVVATELGRVGLMICADGRCPELAACAAAQGVQLLVNPTAWVSWGRRPGELSNAQIEYFIPARAIEHGCWVLSANKVGVEARSIVYCGQSNLVAPTGEMVAILPPAGEAVLVADVDLSLSRPPSDPFSREPLASAFSRVACAARRAPLAFDPLLFAPTESLPITARRAEPIRADESAVIAAVAGPADAYDPDELLADLAVEDVAAVIVSGPGAAQPAWVRAAGRSGMMLVSADGPAADVSIGPVRSAGGPVDSFAPARAAMLGGAELFVARPAADGRCPDIRLLRARASENRIYVAAAGADRAVVVSPAGAVIADSLEGERMAVLARVVPAAARDKQMVPGTDVVASRAPRVYRQYLAAGAVSESRTPAASRQNI